MPILFSENKIQFGSGSGAIKFSSDPAECECCGPGIECLCPEGSEFASPKIIKDLEMIVTDYPATYTDDIFRKEDITINGKYFFRQWESEITIEGFDQMNGTYVFPLVAINDDGDDELCIDDMSPCAIDNIIRQCKYRGAPLAVLTGECNQVYSFTPVAGGSGSISRTFGICGEAVTILDANANAFMLARFAVFLVLDSYCAWGYRVFMTLRLIDGEPVFSWSFDHNSGGLIGGWTRYSCEDVPTLLRRFDVEPPYMVSDSFTKIPLFEPGFPNLCCSGVSERMEFNTITCATPSGLMLTELNMPACSGEEETTTLDVFGRSWRYIRRWNSSEFNFNVDWDYDLV